MNRKFKNIIAFLTLAIFTLSLVACKKPTVEERAKYVVSFNTDGGSQIIDEVVSEGDRATRPEDPTKEGYTFIDWYKESTLIRVWDFQVEQIYASTTIHAKWEKDKVEEVRFTVRFESNGGTKLKDLSIRENNKIYKPEDPLKANYIFKGWYKEAALLNEWNFSNDFVVSNITLYAKWEESDKETLEFTVLFESNDGTTVVDRVVKSNQLVEKPNDPTKPNHKFIGWYKNEELTTVWNFKTDIVTTDIILFAKWEEVATEYRVNFNSNGGTIVTSKNVKEDNLIEKPNDPTKTNFVFKGWYKEEGLVNEWNFEVDKVVRDITLYAKWEEGTSEGWDLINNSNLIDILNSSNLNLFNKDKYEIDANIDGSVLSYYDVFQLKGLMDLSTDYLNRKNAIEVSQHRGRQKADIYQANGIYYVLLTYDGVVSDEYFKFGIEDKDPLEISSGLSIEGFNKTFETFLLALATHNEVISSSNVNLYKKGSSYKFDFYVDEDTASPAIINALYSMFGIDTTYKTFVGDMGFSILLEHNEITSVDFAINGDLNEETLRMNFNLAKTKEVAKIPEHILELEDINNLTIIDIQLPNGEIKTVMVNQGRISVYEIENILSMSGVYIEDLYFDEELTKKTPEYFDEQLIINLKLYATLENRETANDIFDRILNSDNYTLELGRDYPELLVTKDYNANGNYLFDKKTGKVLLNNNGEIIEVDNSDLLNQMIKFDLKKYLSRTPIQIMGLYMFLGDSDSFLLYDYSYDQFEYFFKDYSNNGFYLGTISFEVTNINETTISEDFINDFTEGQLDETPVSLVIYDNDDFIYHDLDKNKYPEISGVLNFENQVIEIGSIQDLLKYNITYEIIRYEVEEGVVLDNISFYLFYYNGEEIGIFSTISYKSSKGNILMNPKYFNDNFEDFFDEPIYYYIDELKLLPDWNFEDRNYNYKFTFRNKFIETVEDLKGFNDNVIHLELNKLYKNKAILFEQFTNSLIKVTGYKGYYEFDLKNEFIYDRKSTYDSIFIHIDGIPYFLINNYRDNLYVEYNSENIEMFLDSNDQSRYKEAYEIFLSLKNINNYTLDGLYLNIDNLGRFKYKDNIFKDVTSRYEITISRKTEVEEQFHAVVNIEGITSFYGLIERHGNYIIEEMLNSIELMFYKYDFYLDKDLTQKIEDENDFRGLKELTIYYSDSESYNKDLEYMFEKINSYNSYTLRTNNIVIKVGESVIEFTYEKYYNRKYDFVLDKTTQSSYLLIDGILVESNYLGVFNLNYILNNYLEVTKNYNSYDKGWDYLFKLIDHTYKITLIEENILKINYNDYSDYGLDYYEFFEIININNTEVNSYDFSNAEKDGIENIEFSYNGVFSYEHFLEEFDIIINYRYSESKKLRNYEIKYEYDYSIEKEGNIINFTIDIDGVTYEILNHELNILKPTSIELSYDGTFVNMSGDNNYSFHIEYDRQSGKHISGISELEKLGFTIEKNPTSHEQVFEYIFYYEAEIMNKILIAQYYSQISSILVNPKFDFNVNNDEVAYWYINELKNLPILYYIEGIYLIDTTYQGYPIESLDHLKEIGRNENIIRLEKIYKYNDTNSFYEYMSKQKIRIRDFNNGYNSFTVDLINKKITSDSEHELKYFEGNYYFIYNGYPWNYTKSYLEYNEDNIDKYLNNEEKLYYEKMYELFNIFNNVKNFKVERNKIVIEGLDEFKNVTEYFFGENYHVGFEQPIYEIDENFIVELDGLETSLFTINNLDYFNRIIEQIRMSYPYIERFYIDEDDFENKWLDELRVNGKIKLNYTYKESYYVDIEKIVEEINAYNSYTFTSYNDIFKVGKDVIEYTTTENNKEEKYVLNRKTQNVFYVNGNELVLTTFKNVFDLKYITTNYENHTKKYEDSRWKYIYNFDGYFYIISIVEEGFNITLNMEKGLFHEFNYNLEISDINETSVEEYDFSNYSINSILDIKVSYNETGNYNQFINDLDLIIKFEHGNSLWIYNRNLPEEITIDIMDRGRTVDLNIYYLDQTFEIIDLRIYDGHSDYINFYANKGYKIMYLDEFININSVDELNNFIIKDYIELADFDSWEINGNYSRDFEYFEDFKQFVINNNNYYYDTVYYNSVISEHRFSYFIEKFRGYNLSFDLNGVEINKTYREFNFYLDENYHQVDYLYNYYYINGEYIDFSLLEEDFIALVELLTLFYTNDLVSTNYDDNKLIFGEDLKIERTENYEFIIYYKDIILKDIFMK